MYTLYKCSYPFCNFSCYDKEEMRKHEKTHMPVHYYISVKLETAEINIRAEQNKDIFKKKYLEPKRDPGYVWCYASKYEDIEQGLKLCIDMAKYAMREESETALNKLFSRLDNYDKNKVFPNFGAPETI